LIFTFFGAIKHLEATKSFGFLLENLTSLLRSSENPVFFTEGQKLNALAFKRG
jgi:hypothetical protein